MDREEALKLLRGGKAGVKEWNRRRKAGEDIPDLTWASVDGANLDRADLRGADLRVAYVSQAHLSGADLRGAYLTGADLRAADLRRADLRGADFRGADLTRAYLGGADFRGANLTGADLSGAYLIGTNLREANLQEANLQRTVFADIDGSSADFTGAELTGALFTEMSRSTPAASFLDLAAADGLETAEFGDPDFLPDYISKAFGYAHGPDVPEAADYPRFFEKAIENIKALRRLYGDLEPSTELITAVQEISAEVIKHLAKHPEALHQIKPRMFEELIAEILASYGWEVHLTQSTKDGGYGIFAIAGRSAKFTSSWIIECKRYAPDRPVGVEIARALYGLKGDLRVANALLATTSHFTKGVRDYKASRYDFALKDYEGILEWINEYRPHPGGRLYIKDNRLVLPEDPGPR